MSVRPHSWVSPNRVCEKRRGHGSGFWFLPSARIPGKGVRSPHESCVSRREGPQGGHPACVPVSPRPRCGSSSSTGPTPTGSFAVAAPAQPPGNSSVTRRAPKAVHVCQAHRARRVSTRAFYLPARHRSRGSQPGAPVSQSRAGGRGPPPALTQTPRLLSLRNKYK